ncbi:hypothetical protein K402DRAFT_397354 [Aulographum hederae CBS 113979]|uniref:Protein ROT1 n=1 Tax=Aulographum hederae CBS 113979 TaxID=1176131 RepID=A0A6G1GNX9_9PEZI|nr:hypothetical protein K402DRAFT_397354 [Aulographum hederae CBS 113979]
MFSLATGVTLLAGAALSSAQLADPQLTGTWASKANSTFTGPGFYDVNNERLIEPAHTGQSYSFTDDGHYETSQYRAIANPQNPACPKGIMQWQHGTFQKFPNGSLVLTPIEVDGRQLMSDPCNYKTGVYTRYNQTELFQRYEYLIDPYHQIPRLNLYQFNGAPLQPLYLAFKPPEMVPTTTLHPTATASGSGAATAATSAAAGKSKRCVGQPSEDTDDLIHKLRKRAQWQSKQPLFNGDRWWWFGVGMTGLGGFLYYCF